MFETTFTANNLVNLSYTKFRITDDVYLFRFADGEWVKAEQVEVHDHYEEEAEYVSLDRYVLAESTVFTIFEVITHRPTISQVMDDLNGSKPELFEALKKWKGN